MKEIRVLRSTIYIFISKSELKKKKIDALNVNKEQCLIYFLQHLRKLNI